MGKLATFNLMKNAKNAMYLRHIVITSIIISYIYLLTSMIFIISQYKNNASK